MKSLKCCHGDTRRRHGLTVALEGSIDWNHDGVIDSMAYAQVIRSSADADYPDCQLLLDTDDVGLIAASMAAALALPPGLGSLTTPSPKTRVP